MGRLFLHIVRSPESLEVEEEGRKSESERLLLAVKVENGDYELKNVRKWLEMASVYSQNENRETHSYNLKLLNFIKTRMSQITDSVLEPPENAASMAFIW